MPKCSGKTCNTELLFAKNIKTGRVGPLQRVTVAEVDDPDARFPEITRTYSAYVFHHPFCPDRASFPSRGGRGGSR